MIESKESKTRDIPIWLTALVIVLCLGGGAWLVKWYMKETPTQVVDIPDDKVPQGNNWRQGRQANNNGGMFRNNNQLPQKDINANGVQPWGRNGFRVKTGDTIMNVTYSGKGFDISPQYLNIRTPAQAELAVMRMSILGDPNWREALNVTEDQLTKLRKVPLPKSMTLDKEDKEKLSELWKAYHDGPSDKKAAAEKELLAGLDEVGKKNLAATKEYEATRAELVKAALTEEQIKMYQSSGGKAPTKETPVIRTPIPAKSETKKIESPGTTVDKRLGSETSLLKPIEKTPTSKPVATTTPTPTATKPVGAAVGQR